MDYTKLSEQILAAVGGKENVQSNMVCMTRLRIKTADPSKVDSGHQGYRRCHGSGRGCRVP